MTIVRSLDGFVRASKEAASDAEEVLRNPEAYSPAVVEVAATVVYSSAHVLSAAEAALRFRRLIPILVATLNRIEQGDEAGVDRSTFSTTCALLGFCHELLGEKQAALTYYSRGLTVSPTDDILLAARGILLYGENTRAIDDLILSIQFGPPDNLPHFFLAHHYIVTGQFDQARFHCERGLAMVGSDSIKSELAEWLAISQSELGFPDDTVRGSFDASMRYDPSNERARRNLAAFEAATRPTPVGVYETRTRVAVRASGMSERRLKPAA